MAYKHSKRNFTMILALILVSISMFVLLDYINKLKCKNMSSSIPGPAIVPIFGTFVIFKVRNAKDAMNIFIEGAKIYGGLSRTWIFNRLTVTATHPKYLEPIMSSTKHIQKGSTYNVLHTWLGQGLLVSSGAKWHARRKAITPAFHFKILEQFVEIFDQQSTILIENLRKHSIDKKAFNVYPYITLATLDIISETAMGVKINAQTDPNCTYVRAVTDVTEIFMHRMSNMFILNDLMFSIFEPKEKRRQQEAVKELHAFTERIIEERRVSLKSKLTQSKQIEETEDFEIGAKRKMALLDILLQASINGEPLSNADIREEVDTFMFEGHDTTASGISYSLYCLSRHPDVQKKMFQEIREILGDDKNKAVTYNDLQKLKYTELVIKEVLRFYPSVPIISRKFTEDADINGVMIPAGSELDIPIFVMMKDPEFFPDPERFDPYRHSLDNTTEKINNFAYLAFSAGPRNCIGQKYAILEMKSTLSKILRHYELVPLGIEPDPVINLVMRSTTGVNIGIKNRVY